MIWIQENIIKSYHFDMQKLQIRQNVILIKWANPKTDTAYPNKQTQKYDFPSFLFIIFCFIPNWHFYCCCCSLWSSRSFLFWNLSLSRNRDVCSKKYLRKILYKICEEIFIRFFFCCYYALNLIVIFPTEDEENFYGINLFIIFICIFCITVN